MKFITLFVRFSICMILWIFRSDFVKGEPCKNYSSMLNASKRSPLHNLDIYNENPISDDRLVKQWYKVESPDGDRMPTRPPGIFRCGTNRPIWMNGALPTVPTIQTSQPVCVQGFTNDCEQTWNINIKYCCVNFFVYELVPSSIQDSGYCFGDSSDLTSTSSYISLCENTTSIAQTLQEITSNTSDTTTQHLTSAGSTTLEQTTPTTADSTSTTTNATITKTDTTINIITTTTKLPEKITTETPSETSSVTRLTPTTTTVYIKSMPTTPSTKTTDIHSTTTESITSKMAIVETTTTAEMLKEITSEDFSDLTSTSSYVCVCDKIVLTIISKH